MRQIRTSLISTAPRLILKRLCKGCRTRRTGRQDGCVNARRPTDWAEHATIGSPFPENGITVVELSGKSSRTRPYEGDCGGRFERRLGSGQDFEWPMAPSQKAVSGYVFFDGVVFWRAVCDP